MIKLSISILFLIFSGLTFALEYRLGQNFVIANSLNVRVEPNTNAPIFEKLPKGQAVEVLEFKNGWAKISNPKGQREMSLWVYSNYLSKKHPSIRQCKVFDVDISLSYFGDCKNGLASGKGVAKGRDFYNGEFLRGQPHGIGAYEWGLESDWAGDRYEGDFVDGERTGFGTYRFDNPKLLKTGLFFQGAYVLECESRQECEDIIDREGSIKKIYCKNKYRKTEMMQEDLSNLSLPELHEKYPKENIDEIQKLKMLLPFLNLFGDLSDHVYANCMKK
ncbi:hypothetical protein A6779_05570 [Marinobacter adhaerens]|uniref:SH3 domain-containing protein n=1 Tax=Marinobacter adhaerens TaxID=1033846 RepID=UPI000840C35B|nr:SH3 domain-containing protein [Marinobacter adhaerens]ODM33802.1 hypothetical protein A6779_05570 [Marinobacter adhaerens]